MAKIIYKAACWDCMIFISKKKKKKKDDCMTEKLGTFKALISGHHTSALTEHVTSTGHSLKWDHFKTLSS